MKNQTRKVTKREDVEAFQKIVGLLVEFDERTGRYQKYGDPENHFMRKAISVADPGSVAFDVKDLGEFVYHVNALYMNDGNECKTAWIHEDGIRAERVAVKADHPVHKIVCVTDIFERSPVAE